MNNLLGQQGVVAWQHFCEVNSFDKVKIHEICKNYFGNVKTSSYTVS